MTHDLVIMAARLVLLKTQRTKRNWSHFLEGFTAALDERGVHILEDGKARARPDLIPLFIRH